MSQLDDDYIARVVTTAELAKSAMIDAGEDSATGECPACEGTMQFRLAGPRRHLWGRCTTKNCDATVNE